MREWRLPLFSAVLVLLLAEATQRAGLLPSVVPAPSLVLLQAWDNPALVSNNCLATLGTATAGYVVAMTVTFAASALAAMLYRLYGAVYNLGLTLHAIPVIAATPLLAILIGGGPPLRVLIAALSCQFPMLVGMMQGMRAADSRQKELMHVLAASRADTWRYLLLPAALPFVFAGLKIAAPSAILGAITAEWAGADRGVGAVMLNALFSFDVAKVWLSVLLTCILSAGAYGIWALVESHLLRWKISAGNFS